MRLACFRVHDDRVNRVGIVGDGSVTQFNGSWSELLSSCAGPSPRQPGQLGAAFPLEDCTFEPPLPDGGRGLFCVGMNYWDHDAEARGLLRTAPSEHPVFFWKLPQTMTSASADLPLDASVSGEFDWEVELGVVIGLPTRRVPPERVAEHLAGYTIVNDVTARDLQRQHVQWFFGKNAHRSSPIGPWVTTLDEAGYPPQLEMELTVNGVTKQRAQTGDLIFDVPTLVSTLSRSIELLPGDVIATGTPQGVGFARTPPEFLEVGDVIEARIDGLGLQRNTVVVDEGAPETPGAVRDLAGTS